MVVEGCRSSIVSAVPVQELNELEKERIRIQAERDVEMRLAQGGGEIQIAGEGGYDDSPQQLEQKKKSMYILMGVVAMIIIIVVVAVAVKFAGGSDQLRGPSPTPPTNTFAPSLALEGYDNLQDGSGDEESYTVEDECNDALELDLTTGDLTLPGTTKGAHIDSMIQVCGTVRSNGKGVWYALDGDDGRWLASTCNNTRFDTQISIYKGSCGRLECVAANDQQCGNGDQSRVAFYAESGSKYYVLVHGDRTRTGNFHLEMTNSMPNNVNCVDAVEVEVPTANELTGEFNPLTIFGTTTGVIYGSDAGGFFDGGVWFRTVFPLSGQYHEVHLETQTTGFIGEIAIFTFAEDPNGPCDTSLVVTREDFAGSHKFYPENNAGEVYFIFVRPKRDKPNGDFELVVQAHAVGVVVRPKGCPEPPLPAPKNTDCHSPDLILTGGSVIGETSKLECSYWTNNTYWNNTFETSCGNNVFTTSPGYWYRFSYNITVLEGSDAPLLPLTFSTCNNQTTFDTQISIFRGDFPMLQSDCSNLECVAGNDQGPSSCGDKSTVSILAENGSNYYIYVHGFGDRGRGKFLLTVEEQSDPLSVSTECGNANEIEPDGISTMGSIENLGTPLGVRSCFGRNSIAPSVGAWYHLIGTGEGMIASTCHPNTADFGAMISVYAGGGSEACSSSSLVCVEDAAYYPCGVGQTAVSWNAVDQQDYYILVHGDHPGDGLGVGGYFVLSVDTVADNDSCKNAMGPLEIAPLEEIFSPGIQKTFGSTRGSTIGDVQGCTGDGGRGLWYSVEGTGSDIRVFTLSEYTDFDTRISVFIGDDCSSLECIGPETLPFFSLSGTVSWISILGQRYMILVQGVLESDFGNFELQIFGSFVL
jgi:hypothetical protein